MSDERLARGLEIRKLLNDGVQGDEPRLPIEDELAAISIAYTFTDFYAREGLPLQTRELLTIAILSALGRNESLRMHVEGALRIGLTPEAILETIYHAGVYSGIPAAHNAKNIAHDVFKQRGLIK